jgi:hypothetical protein
VRHNLHDLIGAAVRERSPKHALYGGQHGRRCADAQRQRKYGCQRKGRRPPKASDCKSNILQDALQPPKDPGVSGVLLGLEHIAELTAGDQFRLFLRSASTNGILLALGQMEGELVVEVTLQAPALQEGCKTPDH